MKAELPVEEKRCEMSNNLQELVDAVRDEVLPDGSLRTMDMSRILVALGNVQSKVQKVTPDTAYSNPVMEVLFDMTRGYTHWHDRQTATLQADIMDSLNGSRGTFEWLFDQATLFQEHWVTLPHEYHESGNYMEDVDAWLSGAVDKLAAGVYSAHPRIERMKREILADVRKGVVPVTCVSFSELHDYVDANCYGGFCDDGFDTTKVDAINAAQDAIDLWIKAGGLKP